MQKSVEKPKRRDSETATRVKRTAEIVGCSPRTVYRVLCAGDVDAETTEKVLSVYFQLSEGENLLLQAVKKAVPFN